MATITVDNRTVRVGLNALDRLGCLRGDLELDRDHVVGAHVDPEPFRSLRGIRAPGIGLPRRVAIGRWRHRRGADLVVLRHGERAVVVDLDESAPFRRLVIGSDKPEAVVGRLRGVATGA